MPVVARKVGAGVYVLFAALLFVEVAEFAVDTEIDATEQAVALDPDARFKAVSRKAPEFLAAVIRPVRVEPRTGKRETLAKVEFALEVGHESRHVEAGGT